MAHLQVNSERQRIALIAFYSRQRASLQFESTNAADVFERQAANELLIETEKHLEALKKPLAKTERASA